MKNIAIISPQQINIFTLKKKSPQCRWFHFHNTEEGIAAISVYGNQLHTLYLDFKTHYISSLNIYNIVKSEFSTLPILLFKTPIDITHSLETPDNSNCIGTFNDLKKNVLLHKSTN
jgi:hypothetical protein